MTRHSNRNARRSGGDRKFIIHTPTMGLQDLQTLMFLSRLKRLSVEIDMPYIDVLKKAREDGFFDASDETLEEIVMADKT